MARGLIAALAFVLALPAWAQEPVAGRDYKVVRGEAKGWTGKVNVYEFFMYSCPHCYRMLPQFEAWRETLPPDVNYVRVPMVFHQGQFYYGDMYLRLQLMGKMDVALHEKLFEAVQVKKVNLGTDTEKQADYLATLGIKKDDYIYTGKLANLMIRWEENKAYNKNFNAEAVPAVGVGINNTARYATWISLGQVKGPEDLLKTADFLIAKARAELPKKP